MKIKRRELFTIPNILSYIRILLIPIFVYVYIHAKDPKDYYIAGIIIALSGLTDFIDGFIARHFNQITELGKFLDPFADKLTQVAVVLVLMLQYKGMGILVALLIIKEIFMGVNGLLLLRKGAKLDGAKWFGKLSTAVFYILMVILILFPSINKEIANILMGITGVFLFLSFVKYIPVFITMHKKQPENF